MQCVCVGEGEMGRGVGGGGEEEITCIVPKQLRSQFS